MVEVDTTQREARARELRHDVVAQLTVGTHRIFRLMFVVQWLAALVLAWRTDVPGESRLMFTAVLGATLSVPAMLFAHAMPLAAWVRHFTAASQIGWSLIFVWLLAGQPEAQFHVFVSLAMLVFYRDWRVLLTATLVAVAFPFLRMAMLPDAWLAGPAALWRGCEQGVWVVAEFLLLMLTVRQSHKTMGMFVTRTVTLEMANASITQDIESRTAELARSREHYRLISEATHAIPFELDLDVGRFLQIDPRFARMLGYTAARFQEPGFLDVLLPREREAAARCQLDQCGDGKLELVCPLVAADDSMVELRWSASCELIDGHRVLRGLMFDVSEAHRTARESAQGQKLESVGRIAAGVAHEINTSVQFISDSVRFVRHALKDVPRAFADYRALAAGVLSGRDVSAQARYASETDEAADVDYFLKNAPDALDRALEGIGRVGSIVRSMTEFAHPDARAESDVDINRAISITLNMARNEYKNVADLETAFGELPTVRCHAGDISQVVLNLLLNAAHAVGDVARATGRKGRIVVSTRSIAGFVEISIADTGDGIPESVRGRIFEPFVTTKEIGRGAGQGLALSRGIVVEKLKGSLHFETETGTGTTFFIRLPVSEPAAPADSSNKQAAA